MTDPTSLRHYTQACSEAAAVIIGEYSTSFGAAVRLLGPRHRAHIRNIYALVRVADELVDGVGAEAGLDPGAQLRRLAELERDTYEALATGYSPNPIVHAFGASARACQLERALVEPFFASMRTDVDAGNELRSLTRGEHAEYVYGSAEVVGLMCLRVFTRFERLTPGDLGVLENGARSLGAAFQNVNFLRDLGDDAERLHRDYLGMAEAGSADALTDSGLQAWLREIHTDLDTARATLALLPKDARRAVRSALDFFAALTDRLARVPASDIHLQRVRVPDHIKLALALRASAHTLLERT